MKKQNKSLKHFPSPPGGRLLRVLLLLLLPGLAAIAQVSLTLGSTDTLEITGTIGIKVSGNWIQNGGFKSGNGFVMFTGNTQDTLLTGTSTTFHRLYVAKSAQKILLMNDITIGDSLVLTGGDLDLNGHVVTLSSTATLRETEGNRVMGESGYLTTTRELNAPDGVNPGGLGVEITSAQNLGSTEIRRGHAAQSGNGNFGIERYFDILPTNNANLNATMVFHYQDEELNGLTETALVLFRSEDGGSNWTQEGGTVDPDANTITLSGISSFSRWTAGASDQSLPVSLSEFTAEQQGLHVVLYWRTESEIKNAYFLLERSTDSVNYHLIARIPGQGNSTQPAEYTFTDEKVQQGTRYFYRLSDQSLEGKITVLRVIRFVTAVLPTRYRLYPNYPNPFNPTTTIAFDIPLRQNQVKAQRVRVEVFNITGQRIATLLDKPLMPGHYTVQWDGTNTHQQPVANGLYFYQLRTRDFVQTRRMLLLK